MKTFVIPSIKREVAPTANENLSSGYPIGQHWFDTATGKEYYHSSDGVWEHFATTHEALPDKNYEADFQHVDTTTTKPTLDAADMVAVKDSVTGKMVLTPKNNLQTDLTPVNQAITNLQNNKANKIQEAWITPTLLNGWVQHDLFDTVSYLKDDFGFVRIKGGIKSGTVAVVDTGIAFYFPVGYRPKMHKVAYYRVASNTGTNQIELTGFSGALKITIGSNGWVDLSGIIFKAEG